MPVQGYEELNLLNKKIGDLIQSYSSLKAKYENLKNLQEAEKKELLEKDTERKELENKYERLKISGALSGNSENATEAKKKITELVREIDNCIALLNR
jgi:predicted  nucleic acid-binding Zn-ribbon protein